MVADIIDVTLSLAVLVQLEDVKSVWNSLALWSPCRLDSQLALVDNQSMNCPNMVLDRHHVKFGPRVHP